MKIQKNKILMIAYYSPPIAASGTFANVGFHATFIWYGLEN